MRGIAAPRERERDRAFAFLEVGAGKRRAHGEADRLGSDLALQTEVACQHRQILQRQPAGIGDQDGIAADLHRELRRADDGRADTLARVPDRRQVAPMRQHMAQLLRQIKPEIPEAARFPLVEIFGDAAGKGDGVDASVGKLRRPALGDEQRAGEITALAQIHEAHDHKAVVAGDGTRRTALGSGAC